MMTVLFGYVSVISIKSLFLTKANKSEPYLPGWRWVRILLYLRAISSAQPEAEKTENKTVRRICYEVFDQL